MRYELKYVVNKVDLHQVMVWLRIHQEGFKKTYPTRTVNSIYFDKPNLIDFSDNLAGNGVRKKLRLRWYGDFLQSVNATLEQKERYFGGIDKQLVELGEFNLARSWQLITVEVCQHIPANWSNYWQRNIAPAVITQYERAYFATRDEAIRLTIDTKLRTFNQRRSAMPQMELSNLNQPFVVVELKAPLNEVGRLQAITSMFPARRRRFSKYVDGLSADFL